jgi:hypothetical protein
MDVLTVETPAVYVLQFASLGDGASSAKVRKVALARLVSEPTQQQLLLQGDRDSALQERADKHAVLPRVQRHSQTLELPGPCAAVLSRGNVRFVILVFNFR